MGIECQSDAGQRTLCGRWPSAGTTVGRRWGTASTGPKFVIGEGRSATRQQRLQKTNTLAGLTDLGDFVAKRMQLISPEEYQALLKQARDDLARPESRIYTPFYFVFGIKL